MIWTIRFASIHEFVNSSLEYHSLFRSSHESCDCCSSAGMAIVDAASNRTVAFLFILKGNTVVAFCSFSGPPKQCKNRIRGNLKYPWNLFGAGDPYSYSYRQYALSELWFRCFIENSRLCPVSADRRVLGVFGREERSTATHGPEHHYEYQLSSRQRRGPTLLFAVDILRFFGTVHLFVRNATYCSVRCLRRSSNKTSIWRLTWWSISSEKCAEKSVGISFRLETDRQVS